MGIGTLTYIDPTTKIFGSLGHEISEKMTKKIFDVNNGSIFSSNIKKIVKSKNGIPGEKIASFNFNDIKGNITKNTITGVYGNYIAAFENKNILDSLRILFSEMPAIPDEKIMDKIIQIFSEKFYEQNQK